MDQNEQINSLSYLIPTGEQDIAVRDVLIPMLGDAISCKVPGAACGTQSVGDPGALAASIINVFNSGTLVFVTILVIFVGLIGFLKTAQDGEFLGKSWNTTFTAVRLLVGVAFILPMPNYYSTVQNLAMYVGLWSSGLANHGNNAVSDHYLKRLQASMIAQDPGATSIRNETQDLLVMHTCASLINKLYPGQARLEFEESGLGSSERIEFAYVERGSYLTKASTPCGRLVVKPHQKVSAQGNVPTKGVWNAALGGDPLTSKARMQMAEAGDRLALAARKAKLRAIGELASPYGGLRLLADQFVDKYADGIIQYDPNTGAVSSAPKETEGGRFSAEDSGLLLTRYAQIIRTTDSRLNDDLAIARQAAFDETNSDGSAGFFAEAKKLLQAGGWMSAAATYRTMLDMVSMQFIGDKQSPFKFEGRDEIQGAITSSSGGVAQHISSMRMLVYRLLDSDTGKEIIANVLGNSGTIAMISQPVNEATVEKLSVSKLSTGDMIDSLYGTSIINGMRDYIIHSMSLSSNQNVDPLYQMKSIGDLATLTAELFVTAEAGARAVIVLSKTAVTAAKSNIVGGIVNGVTGVGSTAQEGLTGLQYMTEQIFLIMRVLSMALVSIGYMFSTWLPAIPFIAFLLAQLGWLFGLFMTLFAMNIWSVMHTTPARNDSFIGSEAQGYLLLVSLFFRPIIAVCALSLSYIIAPPVVKLVNMTLLPMMFASNISTNTLSIITSTLFGLILYFTVIKATLVMVYMIPQSFPDEVMRIISAGIGDLGQSRALSTMETSEGTSRVAIGTLSNISQSQSESTKGHLADRRRKAEDAKSEATAALGNSLGRPSESDIHGSQLRT